MSPRRGGIEADPFDSPAEDGSLEVFWLRKLATLENSGRVDDAQASVELSAWDIVVHALSCGKTLMPREKLIVGLTRR